MRAVLLCDGVNSSSRLVRVLYRRKTQSGKGQVARFMVEPECAVITSSRSRADISRLMDPAGLAWANGAMDASTACAEGCAAAALARAYSANFPAGSPAAAAYAP